MEEKLATMKYSIYIFSFYAKVRFKYFYFSSTDSKIIP